MKKTINVRPITEIELVFEDGKSLQLKYDVKALLFFNDVADGLFQDPSIPEICAKVVYIGAASNTEGFTIEEARTIVSNLDPETITVIIDEFTKGMGLQSNEVSKELQKKLMDRFLLTGK